MRFGCLQFAPERRAVADNMILADTFLSRTGAIGPSQTELNVLVLPEMAFPGSDAPNQTGTSANDRSGSDNTKPWVLAKSREYGCPVVVGHQQEVGIISAKPITAEHDSSSDIMFEEKVPSLFNSTGSSQVRGNASFIDCDVPSLGKVSIGQFTDLGAEEFLTPFETQAFARHILAVDSDVGIISTAWELEEAPSDSVKTRNEPDMGALSCWAARLDPLIQAERDKEIFVVLCNLVGTDGNAVYAGTSVVIGIKDKKLLVYGLMGRLTEGLLVVDTSQEPIAILEAGQREVAACDDERDNSSSTGADTSQTGPLTPDTSENESSYAEVSWPNPDLEDMSSSSVQTLDTAAVSRPSTAAPERTENVIKRPTVKIPKSSCQPPQEISACEYRHRAAATPQPKAVPCGIRSSEASTPYPHGGRGRLQGLRMDTGFKPRTQTTPYTPYTPVTPPMPTTPFWDLATPISPSSTWSVYSDDTEPAGTSHVPNLHFKAQERLATPFQGHPLYSRESPPARPGTPRPSHRCSPEPRGRQRSAVAGLKMSGSRRQSTKSRDPIARPTSPKSRNLEISVSFQLPTGEVDCGTIPILASPSIMTSDSRTECGSVERRGRSQRQRRRSKEDGRSSSRDSTRHGLLHSTKARTEYGSPQSRGRSQRQRRHEEEDSRSSSRDSTRNGLLHSRVKSSDRDDRFRRAGALRSQSAGSGRPGNVFRSKSLPAIGNCRDRDPIIPLETAAVRRVVFGSWPTSRKNGQRAKPEVHGRRLEREELYRGLNTGR